MKLAIFGLTMSSSWGNGHATLWRGLCKALHRMGHEIVFFEHDQPYYAAARDACATEHARLVIYDDWSSVRSAVQHTLDEVDVAIVTSYCPDAIDATVEILDSRALPVFYDLDTGVTLSHVESGIEVPYLGRDALNPYELVLSYTGGQALQDLETLLGARQVQPLYGHVDPEVHRRVEPVDAFAATLSYLGTYAADRQEVLEQLFVMPARARPQHRFVLGGAQYPDQFPWTSNVFFVRHLPPAQHAAFFSSSRLTLNVTRRAMARSGWCPSGRLFEAAACGTPLISDDWAGLADFYTPGDEILIAHDAAQAICALDSSDAQLEAVAAHAYERTMAEHTSMHRARELIDLLEATLNRTSIMNRAQRVAFASAHRS